MKKIIQWAILVALTTIGGLAFMVVAGELTPDSTMSMARFFTLKFCAIAFLFGCVLAGKALQRKGWLPDLKEWEANE